MEVESLAAGDTRTFYQAEMIDPRAFRVANGMAAVLSEKCPDKESVNQDAAAVVALHPESAVLIVADGCGGMASGDVAAKLAVEAVVKSVQRDGESMRSAILDGIEHANRQVLDLGTGAGATLAVALLEAGQVRTFHVGDSQIALVGGRGRVKLLTTAHSPVGYAQAAGMLNEQEALEHEDRHLVSNLIGVDEMHVEIGPQCGIAPRDVLVLASDGLSDNLMFDELVEKTRRGNSVEIAARLAAKALERMRQPTDEKPSKPDDLTLIAYSRR